LARALEIAVVGAGISGLASAIVLSRAGHRITVYERFDAAKPLGSGLMIQPTGLAALERLGLREALEGLGHRIYRLHGKTAGGRTIFDLDYRTLDPALHAVAVHRAALHASYGQVSPEAAHGWRPPAPSPASTLRRTALFG